MSVRNSVPLVEVAEVFNGKTPSKSEQRSRGHPVLKIKDVSDLGEFRGTFDSFIDPELADAYANKQLREGDTLILNAAHNANYVASKTFRVQRPTVGAFATGEWLVLRPVESRLDPGFMFHWVNSPDTRRAIRDMVKGIHLYPKDVARLRISLPPLPEQRRIAEILDKADALRTKRRAALAQLDTLIQSIFLDLFGDPATNPKRWPKRAFGEVCETRLGKMLDQKQQTGKHRRPYLRNANVQWFRFDITSLFEMDFDDDDRRIFRLQSGDLLICEGGEPGRAAVWRGELEECYFQKALHRARPNPNLALAEYLAWLLWFLNQAGMLSGVTSATIAHLTGEKLAVLPTMLPPLSLQQEFANRVTSIENVEASFQTSLHRLDGMFASLQHCAFRGDL
ncbi:restriction endonuclease [Methanoculleus sp. Wushi-C6]|uniref:Restriction endonuclease n=1 Tax=Methanoculleus caldifontis TaxID=2651577 RepID=A0ABU3X1V1_9EURY|nr:restriction endonuclease subunit S [Methanoculleus sp. Wushi-C6]MDV2481936.1 restriction endonuclease [Methanoculleus sp. Wushi-C6]